MTTFLKPLKGSEERKYLEEWAKGDYEAREKLILHNMRLVAHVVKKYAQSEAEAEDLISIGTIGLIKAVDSFDVKRTSRLGTYAAKCIDNAILCQWDEKRLMDLLGFFSTFSRKNVKSMLY